ncbi:hypothetical protein LCI18_001226 [Fusarium solani-melongenae]|uniref:Uncharacterized protein n=1 Tax=Fusarium solani subsp. cucurbitae TaxID=2747967 RepID=A0ACD3YNW1_FUSSC|nr:hypothetical protein LCI18_001226 [Fusarium solani-melongenae]
MALGRFFTAAVAFAATVAALPVGFHVEEPDVITTITLTTAATYTQTIARATSTPTGTENGGGYTPPSLPSGPKNGTSGLPGISYAPYRRDHQCKTKDQVKNDIDRLGGSYSLIRIYGTDCDQVPVIYSCAKENNMKVFLGIWDLDSVQEEAQKIIDGVDGDWSIVSTISVGNELVNKGEASPEKVLGAVKQARQILRAAGYEGPVVTVDTFVAAGANPELCAESDYCAINAHAFFDPTISADEAGVWLSKTIDDLKAKLPKDQRIVVCESGWPVKGKANGLAVPGLAEQKLAISAIEKVFAGHMEDLILFSAFNDPWKKEEAWSFNAEPYWGIDGAVSTSD